MQRVSILLRYKNVKLNKQIFSVAILIVNYYNYIKQSQSFSLFSECTDKSQDPENKQNTNEVYVYYNKLH